MWNDYYMFVMLFVVATLVSIHTKERIVNVTL